MYLPRASYSLLCAELKRLGFDGAAPVPSALCVLLCHNVHAVKEMACHQR